MKNFRTAIEPEPSKSKISYHTPALFLGSCFTENIGDKMLELKFPALVNPFGVLYNPVSVRNGLEILIDQKRFTESDLNFFNEQWFSFYHDTEFSDPDQQKSLNRINTSVELAAKQLRKTKFLIITFGTVWVYKYLESGNVVSNCHKIPEKGFERLKLGVEDIFVEWANLINRLNELNPELKIIFTVSPVRHWKDGAVQNQLSKSTLILAIHQLIQEFPNVEYFPAYEIMMDDLRDYRFYADDMLHPSKVAIDYIWEQFSQTYFEKETTGIIKEINKIILAKNHRSLNPDTENHRKFIEMQIKIIQNLSVEYSFIDFKDELEYFLDNL
ncbi:MAG: GSCFA domain-containing protein [Bacteroidales bacterium]|nr:GSCFA domain-containing protein [Bacteroidales bacterium]